MIDFKIFIIFPPVFSFLGRYSKKTTKNIKMPTTTKNYLNGISMNILNGKSYFYKIKE
jgi:hypothetical protein